MLRYIRFDSNLNSFKNKYKIILLFSIILILVILMYNIIINNHSNNEIKIISKNSRRIISNLDNYTETMSDFIVNNNYNFTNEILLELKGFKEKELEIQKELKGFKEKELEIQKEQLEFQKELKGFKEKELEVQKEQLEVQKELKGFKEKELEIQIRKNAIEFLENNYGIKPKHYNLDYFINNNNCIKQLLNLDTDLFSLLLNIDYENLTVSFNYFNDNPIYKKLKHKLEFDYDYKYKFEYYNYVINYDKNNLNVYLEYNNNNNTITYLYYDNGYYNSDINYNEYISNNIVVYNNIQYYNNYPYPYKELCYFTPTTRIINQCIDLSIYNYNNKEVYIYNMNCNNDKSKQYENDKFYRYLNLNKTYSNIYSMYIYEFYKTLSEYEYIREMINLEGIPIIPPIKF
jgi:hypothetical protein